MMQNHLTSIVAIDQRGAIGCQNRLPWSIKSDMAFFRRMTLGKTVVMGRKTYESIGGCLKGRKNLVLSHNNILFDSNDTCRLVLSVPETLAFIENQSLKETFVVGGAITYDQFAPYVDRYLVTFVDHIAVDADAFMPKNILEKFSSWDGKELYHFPVEAGRDEYSFRIFEFIAPDVEFRSSLRRSLTQEYLEKRLNVSSGRRVARERSAEVEQSAFLF